MAQKIRGSLSDQQFAEFCERLRALPGGRKVTLATVQALAAEYGITVSHEGAKTFREGPFARYLEKLNRSRDTREALVEATAGGAQTLDAIEEAAVLELQDHLTEADEIDVAWIASQLVKLRSAITMREDSRRKDRDQERKLRESEKKIEGQNVRIRALEQQIELKEFAAADAVLLHAREIKLVVSDTKATAKEKTERVRKILFGEKPADFKPVTTKGAAEA